MTGSFLLNQYSSQLGMEFRFCPAPLQAENVSEAAGPFFVSMAMIYD